MVEVLTACPTGWKMNPLEAEKFVLKKMVPDFPCQVFKDDSATREGHVFIPEQVTDENELFKALDLGHFGETHPLDRKFTSTPSPPRI